LLTRGTVLEMQPDELNYPFPLSAARIAVSTPPLASSSSLQQEDERQHIIDVLKETNGVVSGPRGAAVRLGLKRTTLLSRMKKMGIEVNP